MTKVIKVPSLSNIHEPIDHASPAVQQIIRNVLMIEKDRLEKNELGRINEDILKIVKEAVQ
jgi:hypothetical protein